jgi:hypothetical protein
LLPSSLLSQPCLTICSSRLIFGISIKSFCHGFIGSSSVGSSVGII